jgi:hypothetical protein
MLAGYWIVVPNAGTSNLCQSTGLCSRPRASALGARARSMMAANAPAFRAEILTILVPLFARIRHVSKDERLAPFRQCDPRIP